MGEDLRIGYDMVVYFYKKWIQPFLAIFILVLLFMAVKGLMDYKNLQEDIKENCGWEDEDYKCYCRSSDILEIDAFLIPGTRNMPLINKTTGEVQRKVFSFEEAVEEE